MGRVQDFVFLAVIILVSVVVIVTGDAMLSPLLDALVGDPISSANEANMRGMREAVTLWVPLAADLGAVVIVAWREFRRQRVTAVRTGGIR